MLFDQSHLGKVRGLHIDLVWDIARLYGVGAPIRLFPCMEATYSYAVKNERKARNTPSRGLWVPWAVSLWHKITMSSELDQWEQSLAISLPHTWSRSPHWHQPRLYLWQLGRPLPELWSDPPLLGFGSGTSRGFCGDIWSVSVRLNSSWDDVRQREKTNTASWDRQLGSVYLASTSWRGFWKQNRTFHFMIWFLSEMYMVRLHKSRKLLLCCAGW